VKRSEKEREREITFKQTKEDKRSKRALMVRKSGKGQENKWKNQRKGERNRKYAFR
jgi:hypothetical protein